MPRGPAPIKKKKRESFGYAECQRCHFVFTTRKLTERYCHGCRGLGPVVAKKVAPQA